jgi:hypothetical protein
MRLPPPDIEILLPVWGERHTRDFLELCLPSLLAPGNLPGLSKLGRCTFVLLAPARDAGLVERNPLWALLGACCAVRIQPIDDLISQSSSTVLTLAYTLAIRGAGQRALDTCFVLLVADYVIADGSLSAVVGRIVAGASGVLAGNFQVEREIALPSLQQRKDEAGVLAIPSRSLVELSLQALHRTTLANVVNQRGWLEPNVNRLFWRVGARCIVGRFFLMHMIAIRPETTEFVIAAASDYSFIPELCPSGDVVHITDSDDYFVIECQPRDDGAPANATARNEAPRLDPDSVAKAVQPWATAQHRDNARHCLIFHSDAISAGTAEAVASADRFVSEIGAKLDGSPLPFRHHPFWMRSIDYHLATAGVEQDPAHLADITGDRSLETGAGMASRLRSLLLGRAPHFRPWHPRWADVRALRLGLAAASGNVAVISDSPARVRAWLDADAGRRGVSMTHIQLEDLADESAAVPRRWGGPFDAVFLLLDQFPEKPESLLGRIAALVKPQGIVTLAVGQVFSEAEPTVVAVRRQPAGGGLTLERVTCVTAGAARTAVQAAMMRHAKSAVGPVSPRAICRLAVAAGLAIPSMFLNFLATGQRGPWKSLRSSSAFFAFRRPDA